MNPDVKLAYQQKMDAQLTLWGAEATKLKAKLERASAEAKIAGYKQLDALKAKQQTAQRKLEELKAAGNEKFEQLKVGLEGSWNDLKAEVDAVMAKFGKD